MTDRLWVPEVSVESVGSWGAGTWHARTITEPSGEESWWGAPTRQSWGSCVSKVRISFEAVQLKKHNSSAGLAFSWVCLLKFIQALWSTCSTFMEMERRERHWEPGDQVCQAVCTPPFCLGTVLLPTSYVCPKDERRQKKQKGDWEIAGFQIYALGANFLKWITIAFPTLDTKSCSEA